MVFYWTTANISYDVANKAASQQEQALEDRIANLKSRKGVCKNYAEVFNDLANKLGVKNSYCKGLY
jgi:transglutaminase/protease-like cytokinesis protein 3